MNRMKRRLIASILIAFGVGLLIGMVLPLWGFILAVISVAVGAYLLTYQC